MTIDERLIFLVQSTESLHGSVQELHGIVQEHTKQLQEQTKQLQIDAENINRLDNLEGS
jgi:hypothetical protein